MPEGPCPGDGEDMNAEQTNMTGSVAMSVEQCYELLPTVPVGRIVFTENALPAIQPVNFIVDRNDVVFRTSTGSKVAAAARSAVVAFEVDTYNDSLTHGWSVVLIGRAQVVVDPDERARLAELPLRPLVGDTGSTFIRVIPEIVRGRQVSSPVPTTAEPSPS